MNMKMHLSIAAAAALAVSGMAYGQQQRQQDRQDRQAQVHVERDGAQNGAQVQVDRDQDRDRVQVQQHNQQNQHAQIDAPQVDAGTANNIRGTLATITEAALTRGQLRSVVQRLSEADQERIADYARQDFEQLDGRIAQFQEDWRDRYGEDFNIDNRELVFGREFVQMYQGQIDEAQLAGQRMDATQRDQADGMQQRNGMQQPGGLQDEDRSVDPQTREPGITPGRVDAGQQRDDQDTMRAGAEVRTDDDARMPGDRDGARDDRRAARQNGDAEDRATVVIHESHGLPELTIHMVNEGTIMDAWRIEAPTELSGERLHDNLLTHLTYANERKEQWPADVNDAYRMVTHHVLMAVMDKHPEDHEQARQAGDRQQDRMGQQQDRQQGQQH